ncbi:MAG: MIP/aquaporin family protein [Candidatus Aminicenantes bacterium]|jgi:MIP family channel proteins
MSKNQISVINVIRFSLAEFVGTFVLVFAGCGAVAINQLDHLAVDHLVVSATFGLAIMCMIYAVGHISGAHFNPAVTISFTVNRHFPAKLLAPYILAQCLGAISASCVLLYTLTPILKAQRVEGLLNLGVTQPVTESVWIALVWEFALTFILMYVITAVATDSRAVGQMAGLAIGGTVCLAALFGGPVTGGSMNPARSLGPALVSGQWHYFYIYVISPILGAIAGGFVYGFLCPDCEKCKKKFSVS